MQHANVKSIEAIQEFRSKLIVFEQRVADALMSMQEQVFHALDYVERDRPRYWNQKVLDSYDEVAEARVALETAKMRKEIAGHRPSLVEEKTAIREAKARLQKHQEKVEIVKQAAITLRHEADEFMGRMGQLQQLLETDLPKMIGMLASMVDALERYAEVGTAEVDGARPATDDSSSKKSSD